MAKHSKHEFELITFDSYNQIRKQNSMVHIKIVGVWIFLELFKFEHKQVIKHFKNSKCPLGLKYFILYQWKIPRGEGGKIFFTSSLKIILIKKNLKIYFM
jgi:hypothetical protein